MSVQQVAFTGEDGDTRDVVEPELADRGNGVWTLPQTGTGLRLVEQDYERAARDLGVEVAAIKAVATVEAGGRTGFDNQRRPKILFEVHLFRKHTHHRYDRSHPRISAPYSSPARRASYRRDQWEVIREAFALDREAAVKSASWGLFQVLGENYASVGWSNVRQFVDSMYYSEGQHLRAFTGFCRANNLVRHLRSHHWAAFAAAYNGPSYADNHYDTRMATAYQQFARR